MKNQQLLYKDPLYGEIQIPGFLDPLFHTKLAFRARDITMGTVINKFRTSPLPSRFHHGVGASHLAMRVCNKNPNFCEDEKRLIVAAATMHDWGNCPFAHMIERLMKEVIQKNGETFLEDLLNHDIGSDTRKALFNMGVNHGSVVRMVTGRYPTLSAIVHGDMDVDNLDNILRFAHCVGISLSGCNRAGLLIADSFRWNGRWELELNSNLKHHIQSWKNLRREVYHDIYSAPHQVVATMIFAAAWKMFERGRFHPDMFYLTDTAFLQVLYNECPEMMHRIENWNWFEQVINFETTDPSERLKQLSKNFTHRIELGKKFARYSGFSEDDVTIYVGPDRMERKINLPISGTDMTVEDLLDPDGNATRPETYRVQVNIEREIAEGYKEAALEFAKSEIL